MTDDVPDTGHGAGERRDRAGDERDLLGDHRDDAAHTRDEAGDTRDEAATRRDSDAHRRDVAAEGRDRAAEERDAAAVLSDGVGDVGARSATARRDAADDRGHAARDREAGLTERTEAERDRRTARTDRDSGALERGYAADDRDTALHDRGTSAADLAIASLDGLTGVYTRAAGKLELQREIDRARRTAQSLALVFVDVDGLKVVNDAGGHAAGDRVLVRVAHTLRAELRPYDLVVRYGGDEFVCALAGASPADAAERLRHVSATLAENADPVSVTVGLSELGPDDTLETLVARADDDLYRRRRPPG